MIMIAPSRFRISPVFAMSMILIRLVPKIMALGGVATGNMNAIEADKVAGNIRNSGFILVATPRPASMGSNISVVAVFDVNSVKKVMNKQITNVIRIG